jgi:glutamine synthetase
LGLGDGLDQSRIKTLGSSANPYLALGGVIAAELDGIEQGLQPSEGQLIDCDPAILPEAERERRDIHRLPSHLREAITALEADAVLMEALGPVLSQAYLAIRRGDLAFFAGHDETFALNHHFYKY